ncbi:acyl carrier protein [Candidatus Omnitrophota bacterium]
MKEKLKAFIVEHFLYGEQDIGYDVSLFETGLIDSLGFLKLLAFIGESFGVSIAMSEVEVERFGTINKICAFVSQKQKKSG